MRTCILALALVMASTFATAADPFSFTGIAEIKNRVGGPVAGGKPVVATFSAGSSQAAYASGKKIAAKTECAGWSAPPGSMFSSTGICTADDDTGKFAVAYSCQSMDEKNTVADCWARLTGMSGAYEKKVGTASWHTTLSADGKSTTSNGSGDWN